MPDDLMTVVAAEPRTRPMHLGLSLLSPILPRPKAPGSVTPNVAVALPPVSSHVRCTGLVDCVDIGKPPRDDGARVVVVALISGL